MASLWDQVQTRWASLGSRDRMALTALGAFLAVLVVALGIWQPIHERKEAAEARHQDRKALLQWMRAHEAKARSLQGNASEGGGSSNRQGQSILTLANRMAQKHELDLKRFQPDGQGRLRVWLADVPFNRLVAWLGELRSRYGVGVGDVSISRQQASGRVEARIVLKG